jgi:VWFA-related protein
MRTFDLRPVAAAVLIAATAAPLAARAGQTAATPMLVDFRAVTEAGEPVRDLKPADVTLRVGGRPREIKSLELIAVTKDAAPAAVARLPPPFVTNADVSNDARAREILLIVDEDSIAPGREASIREATSQLIAALAPGDRLGLVSTRQGGMSVQMTTQHAAVREALAKFVGHASPSATATDFLCRTVIALQTVASALNGFSPDASPTIVFMSAALSAPQTEQSFKIGSGSELCQLRTRDYEELGNAVQARRVNFYVVHALEAGNAAQSQQQQQAGLDNLAGVTGGETFRITGGADTPMPRIARETSAYYLASFDVEPAERNGSRQRVELRVGRERVRVYARPYMMMMKDGAAAGARVTAPKEPKDMMRVITAFHDLPLRAASFPSRNPAGKPEMIVMFEPIDPSVKLSGAVVGLYDAKGTLKAQWTARSEDLGRTPIVTKMIADPGPYRLRVAAMDSGNRSGSVDIKTEMNPNDAGPFKTSGLILGVPATGAPLAPKLEFGSADATAVAYLEIYGVPKGAKAGVTLELAESVDGPAAMSGAMALGDGPAEDTRIARAGLNIGALPPGDIIIRAVVTMDGKPVGSVTRTLRKTK